MKTKVIFLVNETDLVCEMAGPDLFAYFPESKMAYSHVGQHSDCCLEYVRESRKAKPEEYKELKRELQMIGYKIG